MVFHLFLSLFIGISGFSETKEERIKRLRGDLDKAVQEEERVAKKWVNVQPHEFERRNKWDKRMATARAAREKVEKELESETGANRPDNLGAGRFSPGAGLPSGTGDSGASK